MSAGKPRGLENNTVHLNGYVASEIAVFPSKREGGTPVVSFRVSVSRYYQSSKGSGKETTDYIPVTCFIGWADYAMNNLHKGDKVHVTASLQSNNFVDKTGIKRYSVQIVATHIVKEDLTHVDRDTPKRAQVEQAKENWTERREESAKELGDEEPF